MTNWFSVSYILGGILLAAYGIAATALDDPLPPEVILAAGLLMIVIGLLVRLEFPPVRQR